MCANVYNGLRHYRVRIFKPIPNFLRFGRYQVFLKHSGQPLTCRNCNLPGHFSNVCDYKVCFNCENIGHEANNCCAIFVKKMVTLAAIALTPGLHPSSMASLRMRLHLSWWMTMVMMAQSLVNPVRHTQMIPSDGLMSQISLTPMLTL